MLEVFVIRHAVLAKGGGLPVGVRDTTTGKVSRYGEGRHEIAPGIRVAYDPEGHTIGETVVRVWVEIDTNRSQDSGKMPVA